MVLPAAGDRALQGLEGSVGTGLAAAWGEGCSWPGLEWKLSPEGSTREGEDSQRLQCNALAPG